MGTKQVVKEAFEVEAKHGAFFTGGVVEWTGSGDQFLCQCGDVINILDVQFGRIAGSLSQSTDEGEEEDLVTTFTLGADGIHVVTAHKSGLFHLWNWKDSALLKTWKSIHKGPVARLALGVSGGMLASGGSDSSVRVWDLDHQACTLNLRGAQGVVSVLQFHPDAKQQLVFAAADDTKIHAWDFTSGDHKLELAGHFSKVTALAFHTDYEHLISCGRDKVVIMWNLILGKAVRTVPLYESLEGLVILPDCFTLPGFDVKVEKGIHVAVAGERGVIRVWDMSVGKEIFIQENSLVPKASESGGLSITQLLFNETKVTFAVVTVDHNIIMYKMDTFACEKQLIGFSDEILDVVLVGPDDSHIAVASNSSAIRLYQLSTMDCQLLQGHTDLVLSLAVAQRNRCLMASASKDNTVRLWLWDPSSYTATCVAVGARHTASVGSVSFGYLSDSLMVSASQDCCVKTWKLPKKFDKEVIHNLSVQHTEIAHEKDINSVTVAPNDKLIATGSQDKTVKLWSAEDLSQVGVLRGHRRGVWTVRFSPVDKVLASSSADCTVRLWSLEQLICLKTLEGHDSSVLQVSFVTSGMQLLTSGADGLIKLWSIKTSECVTTLDSHDGRVWALAVSSNESVLVSGGSDSSLVIWRDVTETKQEAARKAREELALQEQQLSNLLHSDQLLEALKLALHLDRPLKVLHIIQEVLKRGQEGLDETVKQLDADQKELLLKCATTWNTNSKNCPAAQEVISILLDELMSGNLKPSSMASLLEETLPYTERHFKRLTELLQDLQFLKYSAARMQPHIKGS